MTEAVIEFIQYVVILYWLINLENRLKAREERFR